MIRTNPVAGATPAPERADPVPAPDRADPVRIGDQLYDLLIRDLDAAGASYRVLDHPPEGRTEVVSALRGHSAAQAAKCLMLRVKMDKKRSQYVLAVIRGDARLDFAALRELLGGTYVAFADAATAESLARAPSGAVLPLVYASEMLLVVDTSLAESSEIFFNAARLDRSLALDTQDYLRIARPVLARISTW